MIEIQLRSRLTTSETHSKHHQHVHGTAPRNCATELRHGTAPRNRATEPAPRNPRHGTRATEPAQHGTPRFTRRVTDRARRFSHAHGRVPLNHYAHRVNLDPSSNSRILPSSEVPGTIFYALQRVLKCRIVTETDQNALSLATFLLDPQVSLEISFPALLQCFLLMGVSVATHTRNRALACSFE